MQRYIIGIDLGGTKIAGALATPNGKILKKIYRPTPKRSAGKVYQAIIDLFNDLRPHYHRISALGLGVPGLVDIKKGTVINAPNLSGWNGFPLVKRLKKDLLIPIIIDNDANAAALAENLLGTGKKYRNFVYITVSTGIGGGIILDKKLFYGSHQTAGEVGHTIIEATSGIRTKDQGKLEVLASGTGLARTAAREMRPSSLIYQLSQGKKARVSAKLVFAAAKKGDRLAKKLILENGRYLAAGIVNLANILDPEAIIIGGGLADAGKPFFDSIQKGLKNFEIMTPARTIKVLPAKLRKDSGLHGAIALAIQKKK
jgi:glucokinase